MENLMFLLSESWSTVAADQFFSMLDVYVYAFDVYPGVPGGTPVGTMGTPVDAAGGIGSMAGMFWSMMRFIGATVFVALLAWFVTKKMVSTRGMGRKGANLSVIETVNIGGQGVVQLVKAGDKYLVIGVTKERVTMLAEIDKEQIVEIEAPEFNHLNTPFGKVLSRFIKPKAGNGNEDNGSDE